MKRFILLTLLTLFTFQAFGQIKDFFGVPVTDCNSTKDAIIEKFGTKDTRSVEHKTSRGVTGVFIFDIDIPDIGPCGLVMNAEKAVGSISELGRCISITVNTELRLYDDIYTVASLMENHYGIKLASEFIPGGRSSMWYPGNVSRFKADIKLSRLDGDTVFFTIYTN